MNVLVLQLLDGTIGVHLPAADFVPPPPEEWADIPNLKAGCGMPLGEGMVGYGPLDVALFAEGMGRLALAYCRLCFPNGGPLPNE